MFACFQQRGKKFIPCFGRLRFIGNSPISDCTAILVTLYHFRQHPLRFLTGIVVRKVNTLPDRYLLPKDKAHFFCQSHRIFVLRIMCQPNHIYAKRFCLIQQHRRICFRESTPHALREFFMKGNAAHKCRLAIQINIRSFHRDIAEADLFFYTIIG